MCALQDKGKPVGLIRQTEWQAGIAIILYVTVIQEN